MIALEGSKQRNNNPLAALIPLIALLGNNNDEMPILPPQRQSNIDLSLLQQPPNPQPVTCCSQPSLLQPLPQFVTLQQTYSFGLDGLVNEDFERYDKSYRDSASDSVLSAMGYNYLAFGRAWNDPDFDPIWKDFVKKYKLEYKPVFRR